jgi:hypothetical protein
MARERWLTASFPACNRCSNTVGIKQQGNTVQHKGEATVSQYQGSPESAEIPQTLKSSGSTTGRLVHNPEQFTIKTLHISSYPSRIQVLQQTVGRCLEYPGSSTRPCRDLKCIQFAALD